MVIAAQLDPRQTAALPERPPAHPKVLSPWECDGVAAFIDPRLSEHPDFHDGWGAIRERRTPLLEESLGDRADIVVTDRDKRRLEQLLSTPYWRDTRPHEVATLEESLARAAVVDVEEVPSDVVTMNSRVVCQDAASGARSELQLVYPWEAHARKACLSVLSPLGMRVLGRSVGQPIELPEDAPWRPPLRLAALRYQPERDGRLYL